MSESLYPILVDRASTGRPRPWREKRLAADLAAQGWSLAGDPCKAARCADCGAWLAFGECPSDGTRWLRGARFCRQRLCPMCSWRRSVRLSAEVSSVLHSAAERWPRRGWVMLTLTQRNVSGAELPGEVGRVLEGWSRLRRRGDLRGVAGWLRTLEVTRSDRAGTWHPHLHVLLWVTPSYWSRGYVSHARWVALWRDLLGLPYSPSVEVHRVRSRASGDPLGEAAAEVAKYAVKPADVLGSSAREASERLPVLDAALSGRRLVAWGGGLRELARDLKGSPGACRSLDVASGESHDPSCPVCGTELSLVVYRWARGQYVRR